MRSVRFTCRTMKSIIFPLLLLPFYLYASEIESCAPKVLYKGDKFVIKLNTPHGTDFIIKTPDNRSYEICFWYPEHEKYKPEVMYKTDVCRSISHVELIAEYTPIGGWNHNEGPSFGPFKATAFDVPGTYEVIVSPNIETEDPILSRCTVEYKGQRNKSN